METEKSGDSVRAVDRALDILMAFTAGDPELTAGQLLKRVDLSRPTLYRLLGTLQKGGFVQALGEPQRFRLGPSVAHLAHVWTATQDITAVAQPMMRRLWEQTGETVALFLRQGVWRICVAELPSPQPLSFKRGVGYRERVTVGASGRVILAHAPEVLAEVRSEIAQPAADYDRELAAIRERGWGVSRDELIQGAVAIAAPFFDGSGAVAGSMVMFGPGVRLDTARIEADGALLRAEARALSLALGGAPITPAG